MRKKFEKKISILLFVSCIFSLVFFDAPKTASAQWTDIPHAAITTVNTAFNGMSSIFNGVTSGSTVVNTSLSMAQYVKTFVGDPLAVAIARGIIRKLTAQTVNWINSGFKGNPAFVTDPNQFFLSMGDNIASRFLSSNSALSQLCSPFKVQIRLALAKAYLDDTTESYACTLGAIEDNYENFVNDFSQGGWDAWFTITQNNLNNPYGAFIAVQDGLNAQIGNQRANKEKQLDWGKGLFSWEKCMDTGTAAMQVASDPATGSCTPGTVKDNTTGKCYDPNAINFAGLEAAEGMTDAELQAAAAAGATSDGTGSDCPDGQKAETVTPGSLIEAQLEKVTGTGLAQLELTNSINQVVSALFTQLVERVVGGVGAGLRGATTKSPSGSGASRSYLESLGDTSPDVVKEKENLSSKLKQDLLPQLNPDAKTSDAGQIDTDLFWVPPSDAEIKAKVKADAAAEEVARCGSVGCTSNASITQPIPVEIVPGTVPNTTTNNSSLYQDVNFNP